MDGLRPRRLLAEHARKTGYGRIVRLHRQHTERPLDKADYVFFWALTCDAVAVVAAGITGIALAFSGSPLWRFPVLGLLLLGWLTAALARWPMTNIPEKRMWFAVTGRGLITWVPGRDEESGPVAVPWRAIRLSDPVPHHLLWDDGEHRQLLDPWQYYGRRDLIRAVRHGRPVVPWRLLAGVSSAVSATVLIAWLMWWPPA